MAKDEITYENMSTRLIEAFPQLRSDYSEWVEPDGPHVVYGVVLNPYLESLLKEETGEIDSLLRRIFEFVETLASHADVMVRQVVAVTILESLWGDYLWERAHTFMGPRTRVIARAVDGNRSDGTSLDI